MGLITFGSGTKAVAADVNANFTYVEGLAGGALSGAFSQDADDTAGLVFAYFGGNFRNDNVITPITAGTVTLTDAATNYVEVAAAGVTKNTTGFTSGKTPLFIVTTVSGAITTVVDKRALAFMTGTGGGGSGDMLKSIYDTNNDGIVDAAAAVPWGGVSSKPTTFTPSTHAATHLPGGSDAIVTASAAGLANANGTGSALTLARSDHGHKRDIRVQSAGADVGTRNALNFSGAGVVVTDNPSGDGVNVAIAGGGSGSDTQVDVYGNGTQIGTTPHALNFSTQLVPTEDVPNARFNVDLAGNLTSNARVAVRYNTGATAIGARREINFIEGTGIALSVADDSTDERVNVTINSTAAAGSKHVIEDEGTALTARTNLNFIGAAVTATDDAATDSSDITILALIPSNNLSDLAIPATARTNLGLGTAAVVNVPATGNASSTQAVLGNDTRLGSGGAPTGTASGDLAGTYPNPVVAKINGVAVTGTPSVGQVPIASSPTAAAWGTTSGGGAASAAITASEALAAGDLVNIWDSTGQKVREANATDATKPAHGFVLASVASAASATVYFAGQIVTGLTGLTLNAPVYLSTTGGGWTQTAPTTAGNVVQFLGYPVSTTSLLFNPGEPFTL